MNECIKAKIEKLAMKRKEIDTDAYLNGWTNDKVIESEKERAKESGFFDCLVEFAPEQIHDALKLFNEKSKIA